MPLNRSAASAPVVSRESVLETVKQIVAEQMGIMPEAIRESSHLNNDLDTDSLDKIEIVMELEEHFGIDVPDEVADDVRTIGDIVDGVTRLLEAATPSPPAPGEGWREAAQEPPAQSNSRGRKSVPPNSPGQA
jgi:acyl carrier protein